MTDRLRLTILGCGSSPGVPRINGDWGACDAANPRNRRLRAAALIERTSDAGTTTVAIDCGPDFRAQMLASGVTRLDGVCITHAHADHIHGIDDLRVFMLDQGARIPVFADASSFERLSTAFGYCFQTAAGSSYPPVARHVAIQAGEPFRIDGPGGAIPILPVEQQHGAIHSLGLKIGALAYCSDVSGFSDASAAILRGCDHLVIDALQYRPHPSHLSLSQALDWIERLEAKAATLTHMHTPLDYDTLCASLPTHVRPAHDGLVIEIAHP